MGTPVASPIDDLAARTTIEEYGNASLVTIPGCSTLTPSVRAQITLRARQLQKLPVDALLRALQDVTPPLDEEEENEDSRAREAQARQELENDDCPPCYPPDLTIPLLCVPKEFEAIVGYWDSFPGTDGLVLCAQNAGWKIFRTFQQRIRLPAREKFFSRYEDEARERRQKHGFDDGIRLLPELERQSRLEHWIEFQTYQFKRLEKLRKNKDGLNQELGEAQQKARGADAVDAKRGADDASAIEQLLETAGRYVERHMVLLQWIEQQRLKIDAGYPKTSCEKGNGDQDAISQPFRRASTRVRQGRQPKILPVLGKVRISKATPQKRNTQTQKPRRALEPEPTTQDSDNPEGNISKAPKSRWTKTRRQTRKEKPLGQLSPQRVTKSRGTGPIRSSDRAPAKRRPAIEQPQPATETVTKSGRISRPPIRWTPK